jgi:hypothetical protein
MAQENINRGVEGQGDSKAGRPPATRHPGRSSGNRLFTVSETVEIQPGVGHGLRAGQVGSAVTGIGGQGQRENHLAESTIERFAQKAAAAVASIAERRARRVNDFLDRRSRGAARNQMGRQEDRLASTPQPDEALHAPQVKDQTVTGGQQTRAAISEPSSPHRVHEQAARPSRDWRKQLMFRQENVRAVDSSCRVYTRVLEKPAAGWSPDVDSILMERDISGIDPANAERIGQAVYRSVRTKWDNGNTDCGMFAAMVASPNDTDGGLRGEQNNLKGLSTTYNVPSAAQRVPLAEVNPSEIPHWTPVVLSRQRPDGTINGKYDHYVVRVPSDRHEDLFVHQTGVNGAFMLSTLREASAIYGSTTATTARAVTLSNASTGEIVYTQTY